MSRCALLSDCIDWYFKSVWCELSRALYNGFYFCLSELFDTLLIVKKLEITMHIKFISDRINCADGQDPRGLLVMPYVIIIDFTVVLLDVAFAGILMLLWNA